jgi:ABC-type molybdate transport system substrate-binding protein
MLIRYFSLIAAAVLTFGTPGHAVEIKVLSTNALKTVLEDLGPKFEQSSGHKLAITWGTAAQLKVQIENGAAFDVAVITDAGAQDLIKQGKLVSLDWHPQQGFRARRKGAGQVPDHASSRRGDQGQGA